MREAEHCCLCGDALGLGARSGPQAVIDRRDEEWRRVRPGRGDVHQRGGIGAARDGEEKGRSVAGHVEGGKGAMEGSVGHTGFRPTAILILRCRAQHGLEGCTAVVRPSRLASGEHLSMRT